MWQLTFIDLTLDHVAAIGHMYDNPKMEVVGLSNH